MVTQLSRPAINKNWDFTVLIKPLLADQGPAIAFVPKLKSHIDRLRKLRDEFLQKKSRQMSRELIEFHSCNL
jgi:hypothetical protein